MYSEFCTFVLLALCVLVGHSDAEGCVAQSVLNLTLDAYHTLSWSVREDEECEITEFMVQIWQVGFPQEYIFTVTETEADVSFLEICEEWNFVVLPVSVHTPGFGVLLVQNLPIPADANISIAYINVTHIEATGDVHLHWDLADRQYGNCSLTYRVTVEQDGSPAVDELYLTNRSIDLHFLSPCTEYQFGVRAINLALPTVEGPEEIAFHSMPAIKQGRPTLRTVEAGTHEANITWRLQSYARNPCRVTELHLEDDGVLDFTVPLEDSRRREDITVTVDSLEPDTMYIIKTSVHNTAGWSDPAEVTFRTLESPANEESV